MLDDAELRFLATLWTVGLLIWIALQVVPEWKKAQLHYAAAADNNNRVLLIPGVGSLLSSLAGLGRPHIAHILERARAHYAYPLRCLDPVARAALRGPESLPLALIDGTPPPVLRVAIIGLRRQAEVHVIWGPAVGAIRALAAGGSAGLAAWRAAKLLSTGADARYSDMTLRSVAYSSLALGALHTEPVQILAAAESQELQLPIPVQRLHRRQGCGLHGGHDTGTDCFCAVRGATAGHTLCALLIEPNLVASDADGAPSDSRDKATSGDGVCDGIDDERIGSSGSEPLSSNLSVLLLGLRAKDETAAPRSTPNTSARRDMTHTAGSARIGNIEVARREDRESRSGSDDDDDDSASDDNDDVAPLVRAEGTSARVQPVHRVISSLMAAPTGGHQRRHAMGSAPTTTRLQLVSELLVVLQDTAFAVADVWDGSRNGAAATAGGDGDCVICLSAPATTAVLPCRHLCICSACTAHLNPRLCPVCRARFSDYVQAVDE